MLYLIYAFILLCFSAAVFSTAVSQYILQSTILPIPKPKSGTAVSSDNYRGISLSSIFSKLFDNIVLRRYYEMLCTSDLQFSFKKVIY